MPHPLEPYFILKIQTDGSITPSHAFKTACEILLSTISNLQVEFAREFDYKAIDDDEAVARPAVTAGGYGGGDAYGMRPAAGSTRMRTHDYADY